MKPKPRTSHAARPIELVEVMNRSLLEYPLCIINGDGKKYTEWSTDVKLFPLAFNSQFTTTHELAQYEMINNQKPLKLLMFTP